MLVDKNDRAPHDLTRVGLDEEWEVKYWCSRFSVTEGELRACVLEMGPEVEKVTEHLTRDDAKKIFSNTGED